MIQDTDNDYPVGKKKTDLSTPNTSDSDSHIIIEGKKIDNPGLGNCAFYAFAIGLIEIIQEEKIAYGSRRPMFKQWVALDPSINTENLYDDICSFDYKKPKNRLLDQLQKSLRQIVCECTLSELRQACASSRAANDYKKLTATSSFMNFSFLYYDNLEWIDSDYNEYANLQDVKKALDALVRGALERKSLEHDEQLELNVLTSDALGQAALKLKTLLNEILKTDVAKLGELKSEAIRLQGAIIKALKAQMEILTLDVLEAEKLTELKIDVVRLQEVINDALRDEALKIIHNNPLIAVEEHEQLTLAPIFMSLFYGSDVDLNLITAETKPKADSPIIKAAKVITQNSFWGTHGHLNHLGNVFGVNLHTLINGKVNYVFVDDPDRHVITVNNINDAHWTTMVTRAKSLCVFSGDDEKATNTAPQVTEMDKSAAEKKVNDTLKTKEVPNKARTSGESVKKIEPAKVETPLKIVKQEHASSINNLMLASLKAQVANAVKEYCNYSNSIWFSFFHRHGETGRNRAKSFGDKLSACMDYNDAKKIVIDFLKDRKNGNTHPHSFRTMLLQELLTKNKSAPDLKYLSNNFSEQLDILQIHLNIETKSFQSSRRI